MKLRWINVMLLTVLVCGCGIVNTEENDVEEAKKQVVNWLIPVEEMIDKETEVVIEEGLNELLGDAEIILDIEYVSVEQYEKIIQDENYRDNWDMGFSSNWANDYIKESSTRKFAELDSFLEESKLNDIIPDYAWEALRINGNIYGIPSVQSWLSEEGYYIRKDVVEEYQLSEIEFLDIQSLTDVLQEMDQSEDEELLSLPKDSYYETQLTSWGYLGIDGISNMAVIDVDSGFTVKNPYSTVSFEEFCIQMYEWNQNGYIREDSSIYSQNDAQIIADLSKGKIAIYPIQEIANEVEEFMEEDGVSIYKKVLTSEAVVESGPLLQGITVINKESNAVEACLEIVYQFLSNEEFYHTLMFGDDENRMLETYVIGDGRLFENDTEGYNIEHLPQSKLLGFNFRTDKVQEEIDSVNVVLESELKLLESGCVDVEIFLPEFQEKLEVAGINRIVAECQVQLDQWLRRQGIEEDES